MARTKSPISIKVSDSENSDTRTINITINAKPSTFWLSDILSSEGAILTLSKHLESATNKAITDYLESSKSLIRKLKS